MAQTTEQKELSRLGGLRGAATNKKNRELAKADPLFFIKKNLPAHFKELEAAAKGQGPWKGLPLQSRLAALLKVIEYGVGKPIGVDKQTPRSETGSADEGGGVEAAEGVRFD